MENNQESVFYDLRKMTSNFQKIASTVSFLTGAKPGNLQTAITPQRDVRTSRNFQRLWRTSGTTTWCRHIATPTSGFAARWR